MDTSLGGTLGHVLAASTKHNSSPGNGRAVPLYQLLLLSVSKHSRKVQQPCPHGPAAALWRGGGGGGGGGGGEGEGGGWRRVDDLHRR